MSDISKLNRKIDALGRKNAKFNDDVQLILVQCAYQAFEHSNVDPVTRLAKVLKGTDARAIIRWVEGHMPAIWIKAEVKFRFNKSFVGEYDALTLMAEPWWELATKVKNVSSSLDCLDAVRDLIKRLEREVAAGKKEVTHTEAIVALKAVCGGIERAES